MTGSLAADFGEFQSQLTTKGLDGTARSDAPAHLGGDDGRPIRIDADAISIVSNRDATILKDTKNFLMFLEQEFDIVGIQRGVAENASIEHVGSHDGAK